MKTITKFIYAAVAAVVVAIGSATANGALNDLFVSSNGNGDNGGGFIYQDTSTGAQSTFASGLSRPRGIAIGSSGNLFVATSTFDDVNLAWVGTIVGITPGGVQSTFADVGNYFLEGVAIDLSRNVFVIASGDTSIG
jgi:hypothetical protein